MVPWLIIRTAGGLSMGDFVEHVEERALSTGSLGWPPRPTSGAAALPSA